MAVPSEIERLLPRRRRSTGDLHARRAVSVMAFGTIRKAESGAKGHVTATVPPG